MKTVYQNRVPMSAWAEDDIPSQKMLLKGKNSLSDAELLSIILTNGITPEESLNISRQILAKCKNSLFEFWKMSITDLQSITGIGLKKAVLIASIFELSRRRNESEIVAREKIVSSRDAFTIFHSLMGDLPYEEFWALFMNKANRIIRKVRISEGGVSGTVVDPKKVFKMALDSHCSSIILGHNHPSGNIQPSDADHKITKKLKDSGIMLDIAVLDHIIIGGDQYYSFCDEGTL